MVMWVNVGVDPKIQLGAVDHCPAKNRLLFVDGVERATKYVERELRLIERANECPELLLIINVCLDIFLEQGGSLKVPLGVFGLRFRYE